MQTGGQRPGSRSLLRFAGQPGVAQTCGPARGSARREAACGGRAGKASVAWAPVEGQPPPTLPGPLFSPCLPDRPSVWVRERDPTGGWAPARRMPRGAAVGAGVCRDSRRPLIWAHEQARRVAASDCSEAPFIAPCWVGQGDLRVLDSGTCIELAFSSSTADRCHQPSGEEAAQTSRHVLQPPAWRCVTPSGPHGPL